MTALQALDVYARLTKQRLPLCHRLLEWEDVPAIYGGGSKLTAQATVAYSSGDYATWPVTVRHNTVGQQPKPVDPVEFAADLHYGHSPDRLAHLPSGQRRQARARDPRLDGQRRVPEEALEVHAAVESALVRLHVPSSVLHAILRRHPRDRHDPLHSGGSEADRRIVSAWLKGSGFASESGFALNVTRAQT